MIFDMSDLIEYKGVAECLPLEIDSFTQIIVDGGTGLSIEMPDIGSVIKVSTDAKISNTRIIKTPIGISLDGIRLTGYKLILEGETKSKVQYVADELDDSVYTIISRIPFISYIVMPEGFSPSCRIATSVFVEDIFVERENSRGIYENVSLLLTAEIC